MNEVLHFLCPVANTVVVLPYDGYVINFSISFEVVEPERITKAMEENGFFENLVVAQSNKKFQVSCSVSTKVRQYILRRLKQHR